MPDKVMPYIQNDISLENFEYEVYEKKRIRVSNIKSARRARAFGKVKAIMIVVLVFYIGIQSIFVVGHTMSLHYKEAEIQKYETLLANKKKENEELLTKISEIVVDKEIRKKAILELSMIIPNNKNIIYFKKNDIGYVHYDR